VCVYVCVCMCECVEKVLHMYVKRHLYAQTAGTQYVSEEMYLYMCMYVCVYVCVCVCVCVEKVLHMYVKRD